MGRPRSDDTAPGNRRRPPTTTARFGSSRRESHDASDFYARFVGPVLTTDATVVRPARVNVVHRGDARDMGSVESNAVALVVTSPPYFAGKEYEESLGVDGVPASYLDYLEMLRDVFAECARVLEPGGRVAVNVANLGRRPYRSLSGDVTTILQDLGLLLRGEVVWWKGRAAGGSCAWGTFQQPRNPVLRDVTERVVIASKGRFDRAGTPAQRETLGLPSTGTISRDDFLEATTDLWEIPPESATRVGHPAPFPVALPRRLIELYTYEDDVVLDPFLGSGSTAVAAVESGRAYIGFETDAAYATRARERIAAAAGSAAGRQPIGSVRPATGSTRVEGDETDDDIVAGARRQGRQARDIAPLLLESCGFTDIRANVTVPRAGVQLSFVARDATGRDWAFDLSGTLTSGPPSGLRRTEVLWKALGEASVLHEAGPGHPLVLLTTDTPVPGSAPAKALDAVTGPDRPVLAVVELFDPAGRRRLEGYARHGPGEAGDDG
jgi:DNA modification methylase